MSRNDEPSPPTRISLEHAVRVTKAVGHPARLRALAMLQSGDTCVCQLTAALGLAVSTVSGHLSELSRAGLVEEDRRGRWVYYRLTCGGPVGRVASQIVELVAQDPATRADADLIERIRRHPPEALREAGLDLAVLGLEGGEERAEGVRR